MSLFKSGALYRFLLRFSAITHLAVGFSILWMMISRGPFLWGWMYAGILLLVGVILLGGRFLTPKYLWQPSGGMQAFAAILTLAVLVGTSLVSGGGIGRWLEIRGAFAEPNGRLFGIAPALGLGALVGTLILPILAFVTSRSSTAAPEAVEVESEYADVPLTKAQKRALQREWVLAEASKAWLNLSLPGRVTAVLHWLTFRLVALAALVPMCWIAYHFFSGTGQADAFLPDVRRVGKLVVAGVLVAACMAYPSGLRKSGSVFLPFRFIQFAVTAILGLFPAALLYYLIPVFPAMAAHPVLSAIAANQFEIGVACALALTILPLATFIIIPKPETSGPDLVSLRPYSAQRVTDMPEVNKKKDLSKAKLPEPKLPSIGAAMKLYVAADWIVMRLLGAGLLGTAYILYGLIDGGRDYQANQISYGQDPMHALYAYTGLGLLMTVPFLLPRFITSPRNVVGGLVKAVLLVATALVLLPMVHVAIEMFTPEIYWPTLHLTVPNVFKAIAGVAVTSALLISFFRQLGAVPKFDYLGNQVIEMSEKDLRELRNARMEQNNI